MEYCADGSLADRLANSGHLPAAELLPIVEAVATGLAELHRAGLIHRDVKPHNILFGGGRTKLADFGLATNDGPDDVTPLTVPGTMLGTLPYLAPELVAGGRASAASDVYALGVTAFQALTGEYPPREADPDREAVTAGEREPSVPAAIRRALDPAPANRPKPAEFAAALTAEVEAAADSSVGVVDSEEPRSEAVVAPVDLDAPTVVVAPMPEMAPSLAAVPIPRTLSAAPERDTATPPAQPRSARIALPPGLAPIVIVAIVVVVVVLLGASALGSAFNGVVLPTSSAGVAVPTPTAAAGGPSLAPSTQQALDAVVAGIEAARGGKDGLSGKDANELEQLVATVRTDLEEGRLDAARTAAQALDDRVRELGDRLDPQRRDALQAAADNLVAAI